MGKPKADDYAAALDQLEQMRAAGTISHGQYEVHRARLTAEAARPARTPAMKFLILVGCIIAILVLLRILGYIAIAAGLRQAR